jgi:hypothetical protein
LISPKLRITEPAYVALTNGDDYVDSGDGLSFLLARLVELTKTGGEADAAEDYAVWKGVRLVAVVRAGGEVMRIGRRARNETCPNSGRSPE